MHFEDHEGLGPLNTRDLLEFIVEKGDEVPSIFAKYLRNQVEFSSSLEQIRDLGQHRDLISNRRDQACLNRDANQGSLLPSHVMGFNDRHNLQDDLLESLRFADSQFSGNLRESHSPIILQE